MPSRPWEVGGWLLGYRSGKAITITHATPPRSRGTARGVTISGRGHRPFFDAAWAASGGVITYVGDWHTHPGGPALPSVRDRDAGHQIAHDPDFGTNTPIVAIVATPRWPFGRRRVEIGAFLGAAEGPLLAAHARLFDDFGPVSGAAPIAW